MQKTLLFTLAVTTCFTSFAKKDKTRTHASQKQFNSSTMPAAKTTGVGDTLILSNISSNDTLTILSYPDDGYTSGNNSYGDNGFAERYDFNPADSAVQILGVVTYFTGTVNPSTTATVTLKAYDQGSPERDGNFVYNGFPGVNVLASRSVSLKNLGINSMQDTVKAFLFATPSAVLTDSFFVGYEMYYNASNLAGDTIGLVYTKDGNRNSWTWMPSGGDTIINVQNAVRWTDGKWHDEWFDNSGMAHNFYILPIVKIHGAVSIHPVVKNNLSFFGSYPNPAKDRMNVKLSLETATIVTVQITDMNGHILQTISENAGAGVTLIPVNTAALASGNYLYTVRTSEGDGIASVFSIVK